MTATEHKIPRTCLVHSLRGDVPVQRTRRRPASTATLSLVLHLHHLLVLLLVLLSVPPPASVALRCKLGAHVIPLVLPGGFARTARSLARSLRCCIIVDRRRRCRRRRRLDVALHRRARSHLAAPVVVTIARVQKNKQTHTHALRIAPSIPIRPREDPRGGS